MSKRIKIVGNALVVEDTITGVVDFDRPSKDLWYNTKMLDDGNILFVEREGFDVLYSEAEYVDLSDAVDIDDVSFTSDTFRAFVRANMGFNIAGSAALKTNYYEARVIADGGTIVNLPNIKRAIKDVVRNQPSLMLIPSGAKAGTLYSALQGAAEDFTVDRNCPATYIGQDGLIKTALANVPRIDYSTGEAALLVEPQGTNFITYSEDFSNAAWAKRNGTIVTPNNAISPNGLMNATLMEFPNIGGNSDIYNIANVGDVDKVLSFGFWFKKVLGEGDLLISNPVGQPGSVKIDMSLLSSDWEYITYSHYAATISSRFNSGSSSNAGIWLRTLGVQSKFYLWGAQLEEASTASSYIPTNASTVTRLVDNISVPTPEGVTSITETINGVEQTPITTIPATYSLPVGNINKVTML